MTDMGDRMLTGFAALNAADVQDSLTGENRHAWIDHFCASLNRIIVGRSAQAVLDAGNLPEQAGVVVAPVWAWLEPKIDMGRKSRNNATGETLLMPVRYDYPEGPVLLVTESRSVAWTAQGLGNEENGTMGLSVGTGYSPQTENLDLTGTNHVHLLPQRKVEKVLRTLAADGEAASWEMRMGLESMVVNAVAYAVRSVSFDVMGSNAHDDIQRDAGVLDDAGRQKVIDRMLLGEDSAQGRVAYMIDRCVKPSVFIKVDPLKYVVTDLRRSAEEEIRKQIRDPRIGRKIRAMRRAMPDIHLNDFIDVYRERYPGDNLSWRRAVSALTADRDVMAGAMPLPGWDDDDRPSSGTAPYMWAAA